MKVLFFSRIQISCARNLAMMSFHWTLTPIDDLCPYPSLKSRIKSFPSNRTQYSQNPENDSL